MARKTRQKRAGGRGRSAASKPAADPTRCPLTGLPRGEAARALWAQALAAARAEGRPCTLLLVDVDGMHEHAARLGPERADALLVELARRLQSVWTDQALLGRLAGDLFGVALPGVEVEAGLGLAERARQAVAKGPFRLGRGPQRRACEVRVSAGVAGLYRDAEEMAPLLEAALLALWRAKTSGGDRVGLPAREKMVLKSSYYPQGQLERLKRLAAREGVPEAVLLRAALEDLLLKHQDRRPPG